MFESNITARVFIDDIKREIDVAPDIEDRVYYRLIDETEQLLYSEIIREAAAFTAAVGENGAVGLPAAADGADAVRPEDVYAVYAGDVQLLRASAVGRNTFPDSWCRQGNGIGVNSESKEIKAFYHIRPAHKSGDGGEELTIKLPVEWLPIIGAKVRGEIYKLVNEDYAAAKWLADYNALVEQFRQYMELRQSMEVGAR